MQFIHVQTEQDAKKLIAICPDVVAIDTEYIPGEPRTTQLTSVIIADGERAWIISPHLLPILTPMIRARKLVFLQDYNHCDTIILNSHGCDLRSTLCYNLIDMHHLLNETKDHSLGARVLESYGDDYKKRLKGQYEDTEYQGKDGIYTYRLGMQDLARIKANGLLELLEHVRRTSNILLETEINGILVDVELIRSTEHETRRKIESYEPKLRQEFKEGINTWELKKWQQELDKRSTDRGKSGVKRPSFSFASDKQLSWLVYEYLQVPVTEKTKNGNPSTSYEALQSAAYGHKRLSTLVEYKQVKSLYSTFIGGMLERIEVNRIYPHFNVSGTDTGRISHSNPNMANLPTDGVIRSFFLSDFGYSIIGADYTQLEVVIEANLTNDPQLLRIINDGESKHDITAQGLGVDRNSAKTLNFALQYGAGIKKITKILACTEQEATDIYERYWELYSGVRTLKEKTVKTLKETGKVTNLFGRTRHFPDTNNHWEKLKQERQAYNFLIQGVAGDACNRALWKFGEELKASGEGRVMFSVHDEIVAQVRDDRAEYWKDRLTYHMEEVTQFLGFKYPLKAKTYGPVKYWGKL